MVIAAAVPSTLLLFPADYSAACGVNYENAGKRRPTSMCAPAVVFTVAKTGRLSLASQDRWQRMRSPTNNF